MNVSHIASHAVGTFDVTVTVKESDGVTAVPDAVVCLYKEGDVHDAYVTDASGEVSFEVTADTAGEMKVTARKHAYVPYTGAITITE